MRRAVVVGFGVTGRAVAHWLARTHEVVVVDDAPSAGEADEVAAMGGSLVADPQPHQLAGVVSGAEMVVPSPGVPWDHPVFESAEGEGVPVIGEAELVWRSTDLAWVAITGTNGKTTVTTLVDRMLQQSGVRSVACGNIGTPLVEAASSGADVLVAELSSFQLERTDRFRPAVAAWLNLAEDHRDRHPSIERYAAAKARIWANQDGNDLAIGNAEDPEVARRLEAAPARRQSFGLNSGDWRTVGQVLCGPDDLSVLPIEQMPRRLPHDVSNALAACAAAVAAGADPDSCARVLSTFEGLPHRVALVGDAGGVRWYNDSKATTPASVLAALEGFESVVLIAGGRNKDLDLSVMASGADRVRAVVAIGEAADLVAAAFEGRSAVLRASSMDDAVALAGEAAKAGDAVLLSPGCASYDWYGSYIERGEDFVRAVRQNVLGEARP